MIKWLGEHRIPLLLLSVLLLIQSFSLDLNNPWKKPIAGDAQGYYAYLPAIFIYQDLEYNFIPEIQEKYYVPASSKSFVKTTPSGEKVNKTFPGVSLLYFPFFAAAHGISLIFGLPADGYAFTYQLFFLIGFWFYLLLAMIFLRKVLFQLGFTTFQTHVALTVLFLGTNVFFYSVYDQSVTHCYNFFLVNFAVFHLLKLKEAFQPRSLALLCISLAILIISRPTNILVLGVLLFFIPERGFWGSFLSQFKRFENIFKSIVPALLISFIPLLLWKLQTGNWLVYSYGEEGFDFGHPEWINFLFSYTKGWLIYTPVMVPILIIGAYLLWRSNKSQFLIGSTLLLLAVYVFSSWWCWYYGAGMSQRVMIDFYIIPGFLFALMLKKLGRRSRISILLLAGLLTLFNIAQAYQIAQGILPFGSPTKQQYWDNFLIFQRRARIYPPEHWLKTDSGNLSLNPADGQIIKGTPEKTGEAWCLTTSLSQEYSAVAEIPSRHFSKGDKLILTFEAKAEQNVSESRLVFTWDSTQTAVFFFNTYIASDWEKMQYLIEFNQDLTSPLDLYIWNAGSGERVLVRHISWEMYHSNEYF